MTNVAVFLPLEDKIEEVDPQLLAKRVAELGGAHSMQEEDEAEIDDRDTIGVQFQYFPFATTSMSRGKCDHFIIFK